MSHLSVELKEKYQHERIESWEHDIVHEECGNIGFHNTALANGRIERLPRAEYFSEGGTFESVNTLHATLEIRLGRKVRIELTLGKSYGLGLEPAGPTAPATPFPDYWLAVAPLKGLTVPAGSTAVSSASHPRLTSLLSALDNKKLG